MYASKLGCSLKQRLEMVNGETRASREFGLGLCDGVTRLRRGGRSLGKKGVLR